MQKINLKAEKRTLSGRKVKRLRKEGILPANVYGKKVKSTAVQITSKDFIEVFEKAGETTLVDLSLGTDKKAVLIHNVQKDPVTDYPIHVDFYQVDLKEKVTANVPVELVGESPAEKQGLGTVVQYLDEVEVEALPTDLPEKFEIDLSKFEAVDQEFTTKDLVFDKAKVELKTPESILVKVEPPTKEEVVEEVKPVEGEGVATATEGDQAPAENTEAEKTEQKE